MWPFKRFFGRISSSARNARPLYFFNTLGGAKQEFTMPARAHTVRMYNCGPTVYARQHIGNLSMFVFADTLRRVLEYNGFEVKQVINITDFGHLSSDADEGEDKMTKGLRQEKMAVTMENMLKLGEKYTAVFLEDLRALNVDTSRVEFPRASAYIKAEIALVQTLLEKGYAYEGKEAVYFDTSRFPAYGELGGVDLEGLKEGARVAVSEEKHHPTDFVLWKKDAKLGWDSPWGKGFPGWHIECSAMINATLGKQIDIHTGGIEHIPVHHNNEIAQSESATGKKPLSRFWIHRAHVQIGGSKIAKSEGNVVYLSEVIERGYSPLSLRYLFLNAHYRSPSNFSWEALEAAQNAFLRLRRSIDSLKNIGAGTPPEMYRARWHERANDDLDTSGALAAMWEMLRDEELTKETLKAGILDADRLFGLGLDKDDPVAEALWMKQFGVLVEEDAIPERIRTLLSARDGARKEKDWANADKLRKEIESLGYTLEDTPGGVRVFKK
ncbi:MAG TPA: cysteine--tRNA ligase [Candidatus Paceibacterota bacterium]|nr:cysteine--tRNA ligase [Candidatus Paceibacterota bacterium]